MSIRIFALTIGLVFSAPHVYGAEGFHGQIYSFDQLMRLTTSKRAEYLRGLAEVVAVMESQQKNLEVADLDRLHEMKAQVAMLMQMMEFIPSAKAAGGQRLPKGKKIPIPEPKPPRTEATSGSSAVAQPEAKPNPLQQAVDSSSKRPSDWCQPPAKLECKSIDKMQMDDLKQQFRNNKKNECITAGNFQAYRHNVPKPGNCSYTYAFPDEKAAQKINCDGGESLCNPLLFCTGVDVKIGEKSQFLLAPLCVKIGQDMTRKCMAKFDEATVAHKNTLDFSDLKKKKEYRPIYDQAVKGSPRACDFSKDLAGYNGLKEKYDSLRESVQNRYKDLCIGDSAYQAMFCGECEIIGKQIYAMNTKGGYGGCAVGGTPAAGSGNSGGAGDEKPATENTPATSEH